MEERLIYFTLRVRDMTDVGKCVQIEIVSTRGKHYSNNYNGGSMGALHAKKETVSLCNTAG